MPILLVNWQPVLGAGTSKSVLRSQREQAAAQKLNILGNPETTRFLTLAALKEVYGEDDEFLRDATSLDRHELSALVDFWLQISRWLHPLPSRHQREGRLAMAYRGRWIGETLQKSA